MQVLSMNVSSKFMEIKWLTKPNSKNKQTLKIPLYLSTDPSHTNPLILQNLCSICNHSFHVFPNLTHEGTLVEPIDINKLQIALSHSFLVMSVFCNSQDLADFENDEKGFDSLVGLVKRRLMPMSSQRQIVGFGRAVSDSALTASIHDVMVIPSLRRIGIGRMIVRRLVRMLANRDIYDIAAVCSADERMFFEACGFGDDMLGSTTMMYAKTVSSRNEGDEMVVSAGRKLLVAPPFRPFNGKFKDDEIIV